MASASSALNTALPTAAPGTALIPAATLRLARSARGVDGSTIGIEQPLDVFRLDALDRFFLGNQAFLRHVHRDLKVAAGVRFPMRVCSMYSVPSSTVNSMSCMSR